MPGRRRSTCCATKCRKVICAPARQFFVTPPADQRGRPFSCRSADDIEIIFRHDSWKANGEFAQTDVHRQIAIVFKTPPYQDQDITEEVKVSVLLRRISDQMESDPISFTYLPHNPGEWGKAHRTAPLLRKTNMSASVLTLDPYEVKRKRKIKSDVGFRENPCTTGKM